MPAPAKKPAAFRKGESRAGIKGKPKKLIGHVLKEWLKDRALKNRVKLGGLIVRDEKGGSFVAGSLKNVRYNSPTLKAITQYQRVHGITKLYEVSGLLRFACILYSLRSLPYFVLTLG